MIWLGWLTLTFALAYASPALERRAYLYIAGGLILMALGHMVFHEIAYWVFAALLWVVIGLTVYLIGGRNFAPSALLLVASGILKMPARLSGVDYEFGNVWLFWSDMAGVAALLFLARPLFSGLSDRIRRMGQRARVGVDRRVFHRESDPR